MEQLLAALRASGEPTRLRLLALCAHMDLTVSQLTQILGQSQPRVSRHLKLLLEAGLLGSPRFRQREIVLFETLYLPANSSRLTASGRSSSFIFSESETIRISADRSASSFPPANICGFAPSRFAGICVPVIW